MRSTRPRMWCLSGLLPLLMACPPPVSVDAGSTGSDAGSADFTALPDRSQVEDAAHQPDAITDIRPSEAGADAEGEDLRRDAGLPGDVVVADHEVTDAMVADRSGDRTALDANADAPGNDVIVADAAVDGGYDAGLPPGERWRQVSAGSDSTCGIRVDGTLWCWGHEAFAFTDQTELHRIPTQVGDDSDWLTVTSSRGNGFSHRCALKENHSLWCWGNNHVGQLGDPGWYPVFEPTRVVSPYTWYQVSAGTNFTCGIHKNLAGNSWLYCWGDNFYGQLGQGDTEWHEGIQEVGDGYLLVKASFDLNAGRACAIKDDGSLWCWGDNREQQIDSEAPPLVTAPWPVMPGASWLDVSPGMFETCAIKDDRSLWCWGLAYQGDDPSPRQPDGTTTYQEVWSLSDYSCGLTTAGQVRCWGYNEQGKLGRGDYQDLAAPGPIASDLSFTQLSSSYRSSCAVAQDGSLWCWGSDLNNQLGLGHEIESFTPRLVQQMPDLTELTAGLAHTCGLAMDGRWCWGANWDGQLGIGADDTRARHRPHQVQDRSWRQLKAGGAHTCGIDQQNRLWCWGANWSGQLGQGDTEDRHLPEQVATQQEVASVALGHNYTCAIFADSSLWCWGSNDYGQLGLGTVLGEHLHPQPVDSTRSWRSLSLGASHSCAIDGDGKLFCWGRNDHGRLGLGDEAARLGPTEVTEPAQTWRQVAVGASGHTCALDTSWQLWCWGNNQSGQAGIDFENQNRPRLVSPSYAWRQLVTGGTFTCGRMSNGALYCWGDNQFGQLGAGDTVNRAEMIEIGERGWEDVSAVGGFAVCARDNLDQLWCWGENVDGVLGDGRAWQLSPVRVP